MADVTERVGEIEARAREARPGEIDMGALSPFNDWSAEDAYRDGFKQGVYEQACETLEVIDACRTLQRERDAASAEAGRLREALEVERADLMRRTDGSTHYDGCEAFHPKCAALRRINAALSAPGQPQEPAAEAESAMLTVAGQRFRCECKCDVFTKIGGLRYRCNACGAEYQGEKAAPGQARDASEGGGA